MFYVYICRYCRPLNRHSCTWKKKNQHSQDDDPVSHIGCQKSTCRLWHPSLLTGCHVLSYFDSTFSSWVVCCGYTRPRVCLISARVTENSHGDCPWTGGHTKQKNTPQVFNFVKVHFLAFFALFLELIWTSFNFPLSPLWFIFTTLFWIILKIRTASAEVKMWLLMSEAEYTDCTSAEW